MVAIPERAYVGVDGCGNGWVAVVIDERGFIEAGLFASFAEVADRYRMAAAVGVDIPIGLVSEGGRDADTAARKLLGKRRSSVFPVPPRVAVEADSYPAASAAARAAWGKGLSKQVFALFSKILEADAFARDERIHEAHPEVSFAVLGGAVVAHKKKSWGGLHARRDLLLRKAGIELPPTLGDADVAGIDDVVDAAVAAWSARRIAQGQARSFPEHPGQRDRSGRIIAIRA